MIAWPFGGCPTTVRRSLSAFHSRSRDRIPDSWSSLTPASDT